MMGELLAALADRLLSPAARRLEPVAGRWLGPASDRLYAGAMALKGRIERWQGYVSVAWSGKLEALTIYIATSVRPRSVPRRGREQ